MLCAAMLISALGGCGGGTQAQASETAAVSEEESASTAGTDQEDEGTAAEEETGDEAAQTAASEVQDTAAAQQVTETWEVDLDMIDMSAWQYDSGSDVYWQVGISYCANPADEEYETLGIFVAGAYMDATDNGDGT